MNRKTAPCLMLLALLVTGCPRNEYVIDLTPRGAVIERTLLFYCADGTDTNGVPNYHNFPVDELTRITMLYPKGCVTNDVDRHTASGEFAGKMPPDVGGAGSYTNVVTTLGNAGFYMERFRGDDDVATETAKRLKTADQLVDMVIGWSRMTLKREPGYKNLRLFLDGDFRKDFRNLSLYWRQTQISSVTRSEAPEEFMVRFGQYLAERGYLQIEDLPKLFHLPVDNDSRFLMGMIQRLVATKLGVPKSAPMPRSLQFLANPYQMRESWNDYLKTTDQYRARLGKWRKEKMYHEIGLAGQYFRGLCDPSSRTNSAKAAAAVPNEPAPSDVAGELMDDLLHIDDYSDDHVTIKLSLPSAPTYSNGKWDATLKQVVWESAIEPEKKAGRVPAFCYANWSQPVEAVQMQHFGKVLLSGANLSQYCLWLAGLNKKMAAEWNTWLASLVPGTELKGKIEAFRFAGESPPPATNGQNQSGGASDFPRQLLDSALDAAEKCAKK